LYAVPFWGSPGVWSPSKENLLDAKQRSSQETKFKKLLLYLRLLAASLLCDKKVFPIPSGIINAVIRKINNSSTIRQVLQATKGRQSSSVYRSRERT
jgi:hypothetical protein